MLLLNSYGMPDLVRRGASYSRVGSPEIIIRIHYTHATAGSNITRNLFAEFQSRNRGACQVAASKE
jgi:hypothetical protein